MTNSSNPQIKLHVPTSYLPSEHTKQPSQKIVHDACSHKIATLTALQPRIQYLFIAVFHSIPPSWPDADPPLAFTAEGTQQCAHI